jgi:hypothetical protein
MMMTKEAILTEIRRAAHERGGRISIAAFLKATGLPEKQVLGKHWATWNAALQEAGIETVGFKRPRTPDDAVLEAFAQFVARLGKWPTENELALERRRNSSFPCLPVISRLRKAGAFPSRIANQCVERPDLALAKELAAQQPQSASDENPSIGRAAVQGYVYMMRSGRRYKIGYTSSPARRHREVRLELPDPTHLVRSIETDDPAGIEAYWHRRFASKRVRETEFFELDASEVAAFKRRQSQ